MRITVIMIPKTTFREKAKNAIPNAVKVYTKAMKSFALLLNKKVTIRKNKQVCSKIMCQCSLNDGTITHLNCKGK